MKNLKKCLMLAVITVLALNVMTGCGKKDTNVAAEAVAIAVTVETTVETTESVTEAATQPTEETIAPTVEVTEEPAEGPTEEPTEPEGARGVVCNTRNLNVRKAPGVANERIARLSRGTEVTVYETIKKYGAIWGRIDEGWVCMDYIKLDGDVPECGIDLDEPVRKPTESAEEETEPEKETIVPTEPAHEHAYQEKVITPACTEEGYSTYTCSCGDSYKDSYVEALGHKWSQWKTTKEPTETSEGKSERTCSLCDQKETKTLPKLIPDHTHKYTEKVTKEPTCTATGTKTFTCSCGDQYMETLPKAEHKYTDKVTAPTCTEKGYTIHTCEKCGDSYKDTYRNAAGHNYTVSDSEKATCTEGGYTQYSCTRCTDSKTENIKATGHDFEKYDSKTATCTERGYTKYTCRNCSETKTDAIKATGHNWGSWVTVKEPTESSTGEAERACSKCSNKETKALDKLPPKPIEPPAEPTDPSAPAECYHVTNSNFFGKYQKIAPTCTEAGYWLTKCTACGEPGPTKPSYEPATGHKYEVTDSRELNCSQNGYIAYCCTVCGDAYTEAKEGGHIWKWNFWTDPNGYTREYWACSAGDWRWVEEIDGGDLAYAFKDHVERDHDGVFYKYSYANNIEYVGEPSRFWYECSRCGKTVDVGYGDPKPPVFD